MPAMAPKKMLYPARKARNEAAEARMYQDWIMIPIQ